MRPIFKKYPKILSQKTNCRTKGKLIYKNLLALILMVKIQHFVTEKKKNKQEHYWYFLKVCSISKTDSTIISNLNYWKCVSGETKHSKKEA